MVVVSHRGGPAGPELDALLDGVFGALAHPTRRALMSRLARQGSASVSELAEPFDVDWIERHRVYWEGRLDALAEYLETDGGGAPAVGDEVDEDDDDDGGRTHP